MECQTENTKIQNEPHISVFNQLKSQTGKHNQSWIWMYKSQTVPNWAAINSLHCKARGWREECYPLLDDGDPHLKARDVADVVLLVGGGRALLPRGLHLAAA